MNDFYLNYPTDILIKNQTHHILSNSNSLEFHSSLDIADDGLLKEDINLNSSDK